MARKKAREYTAADYEAIKDQLTDRQRELYHTIRELVQATETPCDDRVSHLYDLSRMLLTTTTALDCMDDFIKIAQYQGSYSGLPFKPEECGIEELAHA